MYSCRSLYGWCGPEVRRMEIFTGESKIDQALCSMLGRFPLNRTIWLCSYYLLQIGPFVDSNHPFIRNGDVDQSPASLFHDVFLRGLSDLLDDLPGSIAVIVPSVRDIISDHAVFPQSELRVKGDLNPVSGTSTDCESYTDGLIFGIADHDVAESMSLFSQRRMVCSD